MNVKYFRGFDLSRDFEFFRDESTDYADYVYWVYWGYLRQLDGKVSPFQQVCKRERSRLVEL